MARSPELLVTSDARSPKKTLASTVPRGPAEDVGFFGARGRRPAQHLERRIDHQPAGHHHGCHDIRHRRAPGARTHGPTGGMEHWPNRPRPSKDLEYLPPLIHSSNLGLLDPNCFLLLVHAKVMDVSRLCPKAGWTMQGGASSKCVRVQPPKGIYPTSLVPLKKRMSPLP